MASSKDYLDFILEQLSAETSFIDCFTKIVIVVK